VSQKTSIEWTEATWNMIRGVNARHTCARISSGCDNCYAATMTRRGLMGTAPIDYGVGERPNDPARLDEDALRQPLRWKKARKVFVCSMTDVAGSWVPDAWLDRIWAVMALAPQHEYQVLTKRPSRLWEWFRSDPYERVLRAAGTFRDERPELSGIGISNPAMFPYRHVWIGVSVESDRYVWRANTLRQIPAAVRWISAEPLLGGLPSLDLTGIDWLVAGGESGPGARPMHPDWARDLRDRSQAAGVAYHFKQWGAWLPGTVDPERFQTHHQDGSHNAHQGKRHHWWEGVRTGTHPGGAAPGLVSTRVGKKAAGRLLDGRTWDQFPEPQLATV
jgi:protein gp37